MNDWQKERFIKNREVDMAMRFMAWVDFGSNVLPAEREDEESPFGSYLPD